MALSALDSFYFKFKNLSSAEENAILTFKSEAGRSVIMLSIDLGHVLSCPGPVLQRPRNGPARQRRLEKLAAARKIAEEDSTTSAKEAVGEKSAKEATTKEPNTTEKVGQETVKADKASAEDALNETAAAKATLEDTELADEFCSNESYHQPNENSTEPPQPTKPTLSRGLGGFDYYSMSYEDPSSPSDSD